MTGIEDYWSGETYTLHSSKNEVADSSIEIVESEEP